MDVDVVTGGSPAKQREGLVGCQLLVCDQMAKGCRLHRPEARVERHDPRTAAERERHQLITVPNANHLIRVASEPFGQRWVGRGVVRGEEEGADRDHAWAQPRWRGKI